MSLTIGYWKIRGLAAGIRYQLAASGVQDYEMVEYEQGEGPEFSRATWMDVKPTLGLAFPNLPYLIDGDHSMTETAAIHKYLADKYKPEFLGTTAAEKGHANMMSGVIGDLKGDLGGAAYGTGVKEDISKAATKRLPAIIAFRGNNKFLLENPTWVDFGFFELIQQLHFFNPDFFTEFPSLEGYCDNMRALPGLSEYLADPNHREATHKFNNKSAKLNN